VTPFSMITEMCVCGGGGGGHPRGTSHSCPKIGELVSFCSFSAERQAGKLWIPTFLVWLDDGIEPRITDWPLYQWAL